MTVTSASSVGDRLRRARRGDDDRIERGRLGRRRAARRRCRRRQGDAMRARARRTRTMRRHGATPRRAVHPRTALADGTARSASHVRRVHRARTVRASQERRTAQRLPRCGRRSGVRNATSGRVAGRSPGSPVCPPAFPPVSGSGVVERTSTGLPLRGQPRLSREGLAICRHARHRIPVSPAAEGTRGGHLLGPIVAPRRTAAAALRQTGAPAIIRALSHGPAPTDSPAAPGPRSGNKPWQRSFTSARSAAR